MDLTKAYEAVINELLPNTIIFGLTRCIASTETVQAVEVYTITHTFLYIARQFIPSPASYINPLSLSLFVGSAILSKKITDYIGFPLTTKQAAQVEAARLGLAAIGFLYLSYKLAATISLDGRIEYLNPPSQ